jgi:hypothetical protein
MLMVSICSYLPNQIRVGLVRSGASVVRTKRSGALLECALGCALLAHFASKVQSSQAKCALKIGVRRPSAHLKASQTDFATCTLPKCASRAQNPTFAPYLRTLFSALESYSSLLYSFLSPVIAASRPPSLNFAIIVLPSPSFSTLLSSQPAKSLSLSLQPGNGPTNTARRASAYPARKREFVVATACWAQQRCTLYFMPRANLSRPKMHPARIYSSPAFGSAAGGAYQAAAIGMTNHGSILFSGVKVVVSENRRGANKGRKWIFAPFICALR